MFEPLYFASQNPNKLAEIRQLTDVDIKPVSELGFYDELEETGATLEENALQKARFISQKFGVNCFAEDTGLEIEALNGAPGVNSARYAGEGKKASDNIQLVLWKMSHQPNRKARFRAVIALITNGKEHQFEGILEGEITAESFGTGGFGYDPIFRPSDSALTLAQMGAEEKGKISHRAKAVSAMLRYLGNKVG